MSRDQVIELARTAGVDPGDVVEDWERASIREIDGGQDRDVAERGALEDLRDMAEVGTWAFTRKDRSV